MTFDEEKQVGKTVARLLRLEYVERMFRDGRISPVTSQPPGMCSVMVHGIIHMESQIDYPSEAMVAKILFGVG